MSSHEKYCKGEGLSWQADFDAGTMLLMEINLTAIWETFTAPIRWLRGRSSRARSRYNRLSPAEKKLRWIKLIRLGAFAGLGGVMIGIIGFFVLFAWYSRDLPKPGQVVRRDGYSTKIYDRNGILLYDLYDTERRNPIQIAQAPEHLKQAVVAIEDKDFYRHKGFDMLTPFRIAYNMAFRQRVVGGSTLTQQLVKNALLTNERSLSRKFKEFVLALQIERTFTKDQILEMYLNEAPYGGTAWGVGTASEIYFNKPISELTVAQSAFLAGLPQRPSAYSPYTGSNDSDGTPLWKVRGRGVLYAMRDQNYLNEDEYQVALNELENMTFEAAKVEIKAPHFVFYVRDRLIELYGEEMAEQGGLKVTTSLDLTMQEAAQAVVAEEIEKVQKFNITNGAAIVMDPRTGEILSMVGSKDYFAKDIPGQYNVAVDGLRQPGSSIKPLTYLSLFMQGYGPASMLVDAETTFTENDQMKPYTPKNYDGKFRGPVSLRDSLGSSLNITAVKALAIGGVPNFLQLAYDMGFPTLEPTEANLKRFGLAVTLGGAEVHMIDLVSSYSAFANGGLKVEPVSILKVEDRNANVLFQHRAIPGRQVIPAEAAFLINHVLSDNSARLIAFGQNSLLNTGKPIAVKTGTTNDRRDNWTIGWSQEVMVGVWVGNNDNSPMTQVASGITGASPIWRRIINYALENGYNAPEWVVPENIEEVEVDSISGYQKHDDFPSKKDYVVKGTLPVPPDLIHAKLKVCRGQNKLATEAQQAAGDWEEKEFIVLKENDPVSKDGRNRWQEGIDAWIAGQGDTRYQYPKEMCGESSDVFVRVRNPENEKSLSDENITIEVEANSGDGIEKIELWIDGSLKETINGYTYKGVINLPRGQHELYAKARSRSGKEVVSSTVRIGTGGADWKKPESSPSPSPSPSASPTPLPTIVPLPTSTPSPTPTPTPGP